jgi:DNA-binding LytR/AlgR family response regulator
MKISCLAVDDESLALELLIDNISNIPFLTCVGSCKNAMEVLEFLRTSQVDLIFLDIQMPGLSGMQLASHLKAKTKVIFLTAYEQYALEAYGVNALDYLVKPVSFDRFLEASLKALDWFSNRNVLPVEIGKPIEPVSHHMPYLFVHVEYNLVKLLIADIQYIEGCKDYVKIHQFNSTRPVITRLNMKYLEEKLAPAGMVRIHKSYLVSVAHIQSIQRNLVKTEKAELPISDFYKEALMEQISKINLL